MTKDGIEGDLRNEKPQWPFSAYGPGRDAPIQLFGGFPLEQSPEEMRVLYYREAASGNPQPAVSITGVVILIHSDLITFTDSSRTGTHHADNSASRANTSRSGRGSKIRPGWRKSTSKPRR